MNFITALIDSIVDFIRRNPLTCICLVMLAVFVPSAFGALLIGLLIVVLLILALPIIGLFKLRRMSRDLEQEARRQQQEFGGQGFGGQGFGRQGFGGQGFGRQGFGGKTQQNEGEVKVYSNGEAQTKRVSDDVGDYVEFEEVKDKNK